MSNIIIKKTHESAHNQVYDIKEKGKSNFVDDKSLVNNIVKEYKKTGSIPKRYLKNPRGTKDSVIAPVNMPREGAYPQR